MWEGLRVPRLRVAEQSVRRPCRGGWWFYAFVRWLAHTGYSPQALRADGC